MIPSALSQLIERWEDELSTMAKLGHENCTTCNKLKACLGDLKVAASSPTPEPPTETLPPSLAFSVALFREDPAAWHAEWHRQHEFKVNLLLLSQERDTLKEQLADSDAAFESSNEHVGLLQKDVEAAESRLSLLETALREHGQHKPNCKSNGFTYHDAEMGYDKIVFPGTNPCTCGFAALLPPAQEPT